MVKSEMLIEEYTGESEEVTRLQLAQEIQKKIGGTLDGVTIQTENGKYDIYVDRNLNIIVENHKEYTVAGEFEVEELEDGTLVIRAYTGTANEINIPREIEVDGEYKIVTEVGSGADYTPITRKLVKVTLPDTLKTVGDYAFAYNKLTEINIPESVTSIGQLAFDDNQLTEVVIPNSVTSIGLGAFMTNQISTLQLSENLLTMGNGAFSNNLLPEEDAFFYKIKADGSKDYSNLICYGGAKKEITIPDNVTTIGSDSFWYSKVTDVIIPNSVTNIENSAFAYSSELKNISLPEYITKISDLMFIGCKSLNNVNLPDTVKSIGWRAFDGCESLTKISIPDKVTKIEEGTFMLCYSLQEIVLPTNLKTIDKNAFWGCESLISINIPSTVTSIGKNAFGPFFGDNYCTAIVNIDKPKDSITGAPWGLTTPGKVVWQDGETPRDEE